MTNRNEQPPPPPPPRHRAKAHPDWGAIRAARISEMIELGFSDAEALAEGKVAEARVRLRVGYVDDLMTRLRAANDALEAAWKKRFDEHPELLDDTDEAEDALDALPDPPEERVLDALFAEIEAIAERGAWPRALHFHNV
jgi:hypothetical protein